MSGIYIHIPFCKSKCHYCDFYSGINLNVKKKFIETLLHEIELRKNYLSGNPVNTIYVGGGTPSLMHADELNLILNTVKKHHNVTEGHEATIEVNPDDITNEYAKDLINSGFNRISIGIQSFHDEELKLINRRHSAEKAIKAVEILQKAGFKNISIDLIYGLPNQTMQSWKKNLNIAVSLGVQHISAYHLSYEEGTFLHNLLLNNDIKPLPEEESLTMFKLLIDILTANGFEHYEISNFSLPGFRSRHNSSYWDDVKYAGLGPSAHSYDLSSRQWNIADTSDYIDNVMHERIFSEKEILSPTEKYNDHIITRLRTKEGISLTSLNEKFEKALYDHCMLNSRKFIEQGLLEIKNDHLSLTKEGIFISDHIFSMLIYV